MRIAIVSDVHANLVALEAVLRDAGDVDGVWCLGDSVGYGPQPVEVLKRLTDAAAVLGNHDAAAAGLISTDDFNPWAAVAAEWTAKQLGEDAALRIKATPETRIEREFTLVHGTLRFPIWEYLLDEATARGHLELQETTYSFAGHTHLPTLVEEEGDAVSFRLLEADEVVELGQHRLILNPGSVGQPRDGNPRASYGVLDTGSSTFLLRRVDYDIASTQALMKEARLPERLIRRLSFGR
jgi:predicted phosphodiesterase